MNNATEWRLSQEQQTHDDRRFTHMIEDFVRRWAPREPYDRSQFDVAFHMIVREVYREAQAPVLDHLTKLATLTSPLFVYTKEDK